MISVSLQFDQLNNDGERVANERLLQKLKASGVRSVEVRTVRAWHSPCDVKKIVDMIWDTGLHVSIHGEIKSRESAVRDVFVPLEKMLPALRQERMNITVHPIDGDNVGALTALADHIEGLALPLTVSMENNRLLPDKTEGDSVALVWAAVEKVDRPCIGICFDFGHYLYYRTKNRPQEPELLPPRAFFERVIHIHIHALRGLETHFPLNHYPMPLEQIFERLSHGYFGLYNLEIEPPRFAGLHDAEESLFGSIKVLQERMPRCAVLYDDLRDNFDARFSSALGALEGESGSKFALVHSTSYLFNTGGYRWGMDMAFRNARFLAKSPLKCAALLKDLELMVITHGHRDHFEESTVRALATTDMEWVIPDFLLEKALAWGIAREKIHVAREGEPLSVGALTLTPFVGKHFRPNGGKGVPEYGYFVTADGAPSMVFPADVRDYSTTGLPALPAADYCFAHVWLGDCKALDAEYAPLDRAFAAFMLHFSGKNIVITHLNESGRADADIWREEHAHLVGERIRERSPDTKVLIPHSGEVIELK